MIYQFSNKLKKIPIVGQAKQGAGNESDQQNKAMVEGSIIETTLVNEITIIAHFILRRMTKLVKMMKKLEEKRMPLSGSYKYSNHLENHWVEGRIKFLEMMNTMRFTTMSS
jgi:hypothetical protein